MKTDIRCKKVAHTRLPSVGFWSWSRCLAVSLQVTLVISPAVGCQYFPQSLQLPSQPLRGLLPILLLGEQKHTIGVNSLPKTVTRQRRDCDLNPWPFCAWVQHSNHSATEPPVIRWQTLIRPLPVDFVSGSVDRPLSSSCLSSRCVCFCGRCLAASRRRSFAPWWTRPTVRSVSSTWWNPY